MSGVRAEHLGLVLPDGDDPPSERPRTLTYDFSRWNGASEVEEPEDAPQGALSFKVYTPAEIKAQPIRKSPPPPPPPPEHIKDVREAIEIAREIGPRYLLTRFGVGAAAGAAMLLALAGFALLADDSHDGHRILTARTETPNAASFMAVSVPDMTVPAPIELELIEDEEPSGTYFELPAEAARKPTAKAKAVAKGGKSKPAVRDNPY